MYKIYIVLVIVGLLVVSVNSFFAKTINPTTLDLVKLAIYTIPIQYLIGLGYAYYYSKGIEHYSYATLSVSAYPILIAISIIAHMLFFRGHIFSLNEILGLFFTGIGMFFFMMDKIKIKL